MRKIFLILFTLLSTYVLASDTKPPMTQYEMNEDSYKSYRKADKELNKIYKQVIQKHADDKLFIKKLKISQRLWIKLKDANLEALFPEENKRVFYGSMYPLSRNTALEKYTLQRIDFLKQFLQEY